MFNFKGRRSAEEEMKKMRYPAAETAARHERILDMAAQLFRERGFDDVSVAEIMKATGLTHGPFYNHFPSKEALMGEAVQRASDQTLARLDKAEPSEDGKRAFLSGYLSTAHRDRPGDGCPLAALASEISRTPAVKPAVTAHIRQLIGKMASRFPWTRQQDARGEAIRATATLVGALVLARAVDDEALSREILEQAGQR